jgi:hypothetical protein
MATVGEILAYAESETSLHLIGIADHDQVRGALEAVEWCAGRPTGRMSAIVGTEISASWGRHVLAFFFREPYPTAPFPRFRGLAETVARVADAGGILVVPHALSALVPSIGERAMGRLLSGPGVSRSVIGIEVCSGVVGGKRVEPRLRRLNAERWHLAELGSSDAHHLAQLGSAYTEFAGRTPAELLAALMSRQTVARWGEAGQVTARGHARQGWRSLVEKPARELRGVLARRSR